MFKFESKVLSFAVVKGPTSHDAYFSLLLPFGRAVVYSASFINVKAVIALSAKTEPDIVEVKTA